MQLDLNVPDLVKTKNSQGKEIPQNDRIVEKAVNIGQLKNIIRYNARNKTVFQTTKISYIKLSLTNKTFDLIKAEASLSDGDQARNFLKYYTSCNDDKDGNFIGLSKCAFPHYSTTDQSYSKEQFRSYIYLGKTIVKYADAIANFH